MTSDQFNFKKQNYSEEYIGGRGTQFYEEKYIEK